MYRDALAEAQRVAATDSLRSRLLVAATATTLLAEQGWELLVVGGTAVDLYVGGALGTSDSYPADWKESGDIGTIVLQGLSGVDTRKAVAALTAKGFQTDHLNRTAVWPGIPFILDFVGFGFPDDYSPDHVFRFYDEGLDTAGVKPLAVAGPEDILFDYMESGHRVRHQRDWLRALAVAAAMADALDLGYLVGKAEWRGLGTLDALERLLRGEPLSLRRP